MKKLSIIMVVAMLLTTFGAMFVTPATAATEDTYTPPTTVNDITAGGTQNAGYELLTYASDEEAVADGAIGRFTAEGGNGYAKSWKVVGGNAQSCGASRFILIADYISTVKNAIGRDDTFDLGRTGRTCIIDGQGKYTISGARVFHFNAINDFDAAAGNKAPTLEFVNVTVDSNLAQSVENAIIQANDHITIVLGDGARVVDTVTKSYGVILGATAKLVMKEGSYLECSGGQAIRFNAAGASAEINGGTIDGGIVVCNAAGTAGTENKLVINGGTFNVKTSNGLIRNSAPGLAAEINGGTFDASTQGYIIHSQADAADGKVVINDGTFTGRSTAGTQTIFIEKGTTNLEINGGTINGARVIQVQSTAKANNITMTGGTINASDTSYAITFKGAGNHFRMTGGTINAPSATNFGALMFENATGNTADIIDGEINATTAVYTHAGVNTINIYDGVFTSTRDVISNQAAGATILNIYGGVFTTSGSNYKIIKSGQDGKGKVTNIYGGTFIGVNNKEINDTNVTPNATTVNVGNFYASGDAINVYGGNFYMGSKDAYAETTGVHFASWAGGEIHVYGGNFYGGDYAYMRANHEDHDGDETYGAIVEEETLVAVDESLLLSPATVNGASIRTALGSMGIRFQSTIGADAIAYAQAIAGDASKVSYGTLIIPADYLAETNGAFTIEALEAAGLGYAAVEAVQGITENADGSVTFRAALINIKEANATRNFVARAYICVDGAYVYATDASAERSIDYVAKAALADVEATATGNYQTAVTSYYVPGENGEFELVTGTAYSKYSVPAITAIKNCIAG